MRFQLVALVVPILLSGCGQDRSRVVLYCAQDKEFADAIFVDFNKQTGLTVAPRFDTEANKSVALYEELVREAQRPRCDVHWNNEVLGTIRLHKQGLLEPYDSPAAKPYPASARAADHSWHAFAARARVLLVNTKLVPDAERPTSLLELTAPRWQGKVALARPNYGTSATQAACLFEVLGDEAARRYYLGLRANGVQVVAGNKQVAEGVGRGEFAVGITDTDDAIAEVRAARPVVIVFPDRAGHPQHPRMGTLFIPNTVAVIRGCPNPAAARQLVDYLLSAEVEQQLAESASAQVPLNPDVKANLPREIETPRTLRSMAVDFDKAADLWSEVQAFLRNEFGRP